MWVGDSRFVLLLFIYLILFLNGLLWLLFVMFLFIELEAVKLNCPYGINKVS